MIRYVASHDFSGLGQETKILYIPMTLHTWWPDHEWKICWCVFDHQIQKWETKKTKEFYVANYDPLYPFPLWISATLEILLSLCQTWNLWHEWDWSCQEKLWIQFIYLNRTIDFLVPISYIYTMCRNGNFGLVFGRGEILLTYMIFVYHWTS